MTNTPNHSIRQKLDHAINLLQAVLSELPDAKDIPLNMAERTAPVAATPAAEDYSTFDSLKAALNSDRWPEAVNQHLLCDPNCESDKVERARGICDLMIDEDLKGLRFLDYGCGDGHCPAIAAENGAAVSVGYEPTQPGHWAAIDPKENLLLTTDLADLSKNGPYDVVLLFDVIDHLAGDTPAAVLSRIAGLLSPTGKVYMRTHPFVSRHGTHLYHELNKAYVHLVFTPEELAQLAPAPKWAEPSLGVTTPIRTYESLIAAADLKVASRREITEKVEPFFKIPKIAQRIIKNTKSGSFPEYQMGIQFMDFVLTRK
jgi:2-polyprenyl-3-methyl-5-hydroxy-6-metoxy-1,4-benzoquinol methylase